MRSSRLTLILVAAAVVGLVVAGLFLHGPVGGVLLGVVVAILVFVSSARWPTLTSGERMLRGVVIAGVTAVAVLKFAGKA